MRPRVRDRRRRLRREEHEDLLVLGGECLAALLVAEEEVAEILAPVMHRGPLQRARGPGGRGEAERVEVSGQVVQPERPRKVPEALEVPRRVGPLEDLPALLPGNAGGDEVPEPSQLADHRDRAGARAGERARALDGLPEHGGHVEAPADPQDRRAQL